MGRRFLIGLLVALVAVSCAGCARGGSGRTVATAPRPKPSADAASEASGVLVDVGGHVRRPGVYRLAEGSRVHEAIAAAGGAKPGASLVALNRAAPLVDGQQVLVPAAAGGDDAPPGAATAAATGGALVSLNSADVAALDALPGIGPVTAQRIVDDRGANGPFAAVDDLDRVPGIGPATIEALREVAGP